MKKSFLRNAKKVVESSDRKSSLKIRNHLIPEIRTSLENVLEKF